MTPVYAKLLSAAKALVDAMETCHICLGTILVDEDPVHCEDCSFDCDEHQLPACRSIQDLHAELKRQIKLTETE